MCVSSYGVRPHTYIFTVGACCGAKGSFFPVSVFVTTNVMPARRAGRGALNLAGRTFAEAKNVALGKHSCWEPADASAMAPSDAASATPSAAAPAPMGWLARVRRFLPFLGPAFLVSVGYMDPGNWATNIAAGSSFGYTLLWVLLLSNGMALLLQALSAKLGVATGTTLARAIRDHTSRRASIFL